MLDLKQKFWLNTICFVVLRWLLTAHWLIPAIVLPPIAFGLTLTSALISFVIISFIFRPSSKPARPARRPIASKTPQQGTLLDGKKYDNDATGRRTVSFAESDPTVDSDGGVGGLVLKATGTDGNTLLARPARTGQMYTEPEELDGLPKPSTPVKRTSGQASGKTVQKSPAPSTMIQRRATAERYGNSSADDAQETGVRESLGLEGEESLEDITTGTETETETATDRD